MEQGIRVKRPVTIKTIVTPGFKNQATEEINKELHLLESQIMQLELQNKQIQDQLSGYSQAYGSQGSDQFQQALSEIGTKIDQMNSLKLELQSQRDSINHLALDNVIVTGSLENYVDIQIGENLYSKFREAEILVKDGVVQEIKA